MFVVEFEAPKSQLCECCGGTTTTLTRFVSVADAAFGVYFVRFSENHAEQSVHVLISVGWGTDAVSDRVSVALDMRVLESGPAVMVVDATASPFSDSNILGEMLDRPTALAHPGIKDVYAIVNWMVLEDPALCAHLASIARFAP